MSQEYIELSVSRALALALGCVVVGALSYSAPEALADGDPATSDVLSAELILPYDGHLQIDSEGANGSFRMRFELFEAPSGGTAEWSEEQVLSLYDGNLSVGLGSVTPLTETLLDAQKLWLSITVLEDDGQGGTLELPLAGRQAITPAPFAMWSAHAADLDVTGTLGVAGGMLTGRGVRVAGDVTVHSGQVHLGTANASGFGDGGHALSHDLANSVLTLNPGGAFSGGVTLDGGATVEGAMTIGGDATLGGPTTEVVTSGRTTVEDPFVSNGDLDPFGAASITGVHALRADSGLEVGSLGGSRGFFEVDEFGDVVVTGNVRVTGAYVLGPTEPEITQANAGTIDLGLARDEGFCLLTRLDMDPTPSSGTDTGCALERGTRWVLRNNDEQTTCKARCVRY